MVSKQEIAAVIRQVQQEIRWKPGSAERHLRTRKKRGHLPPDAILDDYHAIIEEVLTTDEAAVYLFSYDEAYPTVVALLHKRHWLVMFSMAALMETAFIVEKPNSYLKKSNVEYMGTLQEVLR